MPMRIPALATLALLTLALAGCFRESDENTNEGVRPSAGAIAVEVRLTDTSIEMPAEIAGGDVVFEVTNSGEQPHGFVIDGVTEGLEELHPDQLDTVRTDLEPGTYVVYSPVEGDREAGLELELTVTEEEAGGEAPLNNEAIGPSDEQDPIEEEEGP